MVGMKGQAGQRNSAGGSISLDHLVLELGPSAINVKYIARGGHPMTIRIRCEDVTKTDGTQSNTDID